MIIYKITNKINNRIYIGQTMGTLAKRWSQHTTSKKNSPMYNAFRKYGRRHFTIEAICSALSPEHLNELEQYFIKYYDCMVPKGYNLTSGGNSAYTRSEHSRELQRKAMTGRVVSEAVRAKIAATLTGRPGVRKGATLSDATRRLISEGQLGRKLSEATKAKISASLKARLAKDSTRSPAQLEVLTKNHEASKGKAPWNKGLKATETAKKNQSLAHIGQTPWNKGKKS